MLLHGQAANEIVSHDAEEADRFPQAWNRLDREPAAASLAMRRGDEVVFERLDLAEALGIWRHARGRVVDVHRRDGASASGTVDVQFEGHELLEHYLPDLFRLAH